MKRSYNCDFDNREEFFPTSTAPIQDKKLLEFKQRLDAIVDRRDENMAERIDKLIKGASSKDRLFFAVGSGKKTIVILLQSNFFNYSSSNEPIWSDS
jgi:hypothetical protein